ncbi:MAG: DUF488 domain-containing protein [Magnetococcales bacterium]|nr:DUF488 domain-containing protein [Magnetococcales bacterium]
MSAPLLTIGHSTQPLETFIQRLQQHGVTALVDVRSHPYSRHAPHFSMDALRPVLRPLGIAYLFLGRELGARSDNRACYKQGKVQYEQLAREPLFADGLQRLRRGMQEYVIALMCAEKEPLECHRAILVTRHLHDSGVPVAHILADGELLTQTALEKQLLERHKLAEPSLFESPAERLQRAYSLQEERIAYAIRLDPPTGQEERR